MPKNDRLTSAKSRRTEQPVSSDNNFYEVMPLTLGNHPVYRDDISYEEKVPAVDATGLSTERDETAATKRLAIMTLIGVAVVALALGVLFASGLAALRTSLEPTRTTASLEP